MSLSINEQKQYLSENLYVESLREHNSNQEDIKDFIQAVKGDRIAQYLKEQAWDDDVCRNTKVFLVRDKKTRQIVFYYALDCGILYTDFDSPDLSEMESYLVEECIKALRYCHKEGLTPEEQNDADNAYYRVLQEFDDNISNPDRVTVLLAYVNDNVTIKEEKEEGIIESGEENYIKQVKDTFPAVDIKFLCKNASYHLPIKLSFKLGTYVFWEIIVPHILKIANMVGCKYVYLFAADNTEPPVEERNTSPMWAFGYDPYTDEDDDVSDKKEGNYETNEKKLVSYYVSEFKFRPVSEYTILKPHFVRTCQTLIQEVDALQKEREQIWIRQDSGNELD